MATKKRSLIIGASAVGAAAVLALGVNAVANAAGSSPSPSSTSTSAPPSGPAPKGAPTGTPPTGSVPKGGGPGDSTHAGPGETLLTGTTAAKVKAAALAAVPGATVVRVETDSGSATYEAHLKTSSGTEKTVKVNADFTVAAVQDGMGQGPAGAPRSPTTSSGA